MIKVVHVTWADASSSGGWHDRAAFKNFADGGLQLCDTVGMLAMANETKVVLIQTAGTNETSGLFEIPRSCVKDMRVICELPITVEI